MTREDAYYERILLLCGFWEQYDQWLDFYLETEEPLSDIVLELLDCRGDMKEVEYRLNLYCLEKPFDEESVYTRLREYLWDRYSKNVFTKDDVMVALFRFSRNIPCCLFSNQCLTLSNYYLLVEEGIVDAERFDRVLIRYLRSGEDFDMAEFWNERF